MYHFCWLFLISPRIEIFPPARRWEAHQSQEEKKKTHKSREVLGYKEQLLCAEILLCMELFGPVESSVLKALVSYHLGSMDILML